MDTRFEATFGRRFEKMTERFPTEILGGGASLEDTNGPRGGVDKSCRLHLMLHRRGSVSVSASSSVPEVAVAKAISRAQGALLRKLHNTKRG